MRVGTPASMHKVSILSPEPVRLYNWSHKSSSHLVPRALLSVLKHGTALCRHPHKIRISMRLDFSVKRLTGTQRRLCWCKASRHRSSTPASTPRGRPQRLPNNYEHSLESSVRKILLCRQAVPGHLQGCRGGHAGASHQGIARRCRQKCRAGTLSLCQVRRPATWTARPCQRHPQAGKRKVHPIVYTLGMLPGSQDPLGLFSVSAQTGDLPTAPKQPASRTAPISRYVRSRLLSTPLRCSCCCTARHPKVAFFVLAWRQAPQAL